MRRMALTFVAVLALGSAAAAAHAQTSRFKGWAAISKELSTRIAPKSEPLDLDRFLPAEDMEDLLGSWSTFGSEHSFQNGLPNSVSMAIWHATLSGFARAMGRSCTKPELALHARFAQTLAAICKWPAATAKADAVLMDYWTGVMGYNAPQSEYEAWRDYVLASYGKKTAAETVTDMTLAITMNPYFLLDK